MDGGVFKGFAATASSKCSFASTDPWPTMGSLIIACFASTAGSSCCPLPAAAPELEEPPEKKGVHSNGLTDLEATRPQQAGQKDSLA